MGLETSTEWLIRFLNMKFYLFVFIFSISIYDFCVIVVLVPPKSYRIDLRTGNLQVLRLCQYYHSRMMVGRDKVVMCR